MLIKELQILGFDITQSTVSRDLKNLRLIKKRNLHGEEYYVIDNSMPVEDKLIDSSKLCSKVKESVLSVRSSQNILVIKTYPGEAQGVAAAIDGMNYIEILGTVAGDDTIICVVEGSENAEKLAIVLKSY